MIVVVSVVSFVIPHCARCLCVGMCARCLCVGMCARARVCARVFFNVLDRVVCVIVFTCLRSLWW